MCLTSDRQHLQADVASALIRNLPIVSVACSDVRSSVCRSLQGLGWQLREWRQLGAPARTRHFHDQGERL